MSYVLSSVLFGLAWTVWGPAGASRIAAGLAAVAVIVVALLLRGVSVKEQQA